jgi:Concanavalin A-like lectin/glucanases superfamily/Class III signal peptide
VDFRRAQGSFEYILMLSGVLLVVITMVFLLQGTAASANNSVGNTMKTAGTLVDPSYYIPGAKPIFIPPTPADGAWGTNQPNISAVITVTNAQLLGLSYGWNGANYSFYDPSLALSMSLDDNPSIGETAAKAVDVSQYGNNGTIYDETTGLWHMDENAGSIIYDETVNKDNGTCYYWNTIANCNWTAGQSGSAIAFDGINSSVQTAAIPFMTSHITFSEWVYLNSYSSPYAEGLFSTADQSMVHGFIWIYRTQNSNTTIVQYSNGTATYGTSHSFSNYFTGYVGQWVQLVVTIDYAAKNITIYRNGQVFGTFTASDPMLPLNNTRSVYIGRYSLTHITSMLNGSIDEFAIYNRTLSATDVQNIYNAGRAKRESWTPNGQWNSAMQFDGVNDYASVSATPSLNNLGSNFSVSAWIKGGAATTTQMILEKAPAGTNGFNMLTTGMSPCIFGGRVYPASIADATGKNLCDGNWHYVSMTNTYPGSWNLYIDGSNVSQAAGVPLTNNLLPLYIGTRFSGAFSLQYNGTIDEVRVWNRALSAQEIAVQYASNLYKYDNSTWYFSNNNGNLPTGGYSYALYTNSSNNGPIISMVSDSRTVHVCTIPFVPC